MAYGNHMSALDKILASPTKHLGIKNVVWGAKEISVRDGFIEIGEIDLVLVTAPGYPFPYHVIEYKTSEFHREKALVQLEFGAKWVMDVFNSGCQKYFVHSDAMARKYIVEKIQ